MSRSDPQFNLRIPADLKDQIEKAASAVGRSATAEIVHRLRQSFERTSEALTKREVVAEAQASVSVHLLHDALFYNVVHDRGKPFTPAEQTRIDRIVAEWGSHPAFVELVESYAATDASRARRAKSR